MMVLLGITVPAHDEGRIDGALVVMLENANLRNDAKGSVSVCIIYVCCVPACMPNEGVAAFVSQGVTRMSSCSHSKSMRVTNMSIVTEWVSYGIQSAWFDVLRVHHMGETYSDRRIRVEESHTQEFVTRIEDNCHVPSLHANEQGQIL